MVDDHATINVYENALETLTRIGCRVMDRTARELLLDLGASVKKSDLMAIPAELVDKAVASAPKRFTIFDRSGNPAMDVGGPEAYFSCPVNTLTWLDPASGQVKPLDSRAANMLARLADGLPNLHSVVTSSMLSDTDVDVRLKGRLAAYIAMTSTPLPINVTVDEDVESWRDVVDMAALIAGGAEELKARPFIYLYSEPIPPLVHTGPACGKLAVCARSGVPVVYLPYAMMGGTAPMSFGAALVQCLAEILSGLVIHQAFCPGAPFIAGAMPSIIDMRTTVGLYGAAEFHLLVAAASGIIRDCTGLPFYGTAGCTDSRHLDQQAVYEATMNCLTSLLSPAHIIHDLGYLDHSVIVSPELVVLCDEIIGNLQIFRTGLPTDDSGDWVELIEQTGPGGHYMDTAHTMENFRRVRYGNLLNRTMADPVPSLDEKIRDKTLSLMDNHRPEPLQDKLLAEVDRMKAGWEKNH
jgi:trimethylamine--corrinoid protein Co-methyltransferase